MPQRFDESVDRIARFHPEDSTDEVEERLWTVHRRNPADQSALYELASYRYAKDYDRLLYSSGLRRLGGVTQVVTSAEIGPFHNRLTHSLKVAQTASLICGSLRRESNNSGRTRIAKFGGLHPTVVRVASMAHDIGHPPFGHIGEIALQDILESPGEYLGASFVGAGLTSDSLNASQDSFEGNAQSFRIVTRLAFREKRTMQSVSNPALNLTRASLAAISKYPWSSRDPRRWEKRNKFGAYHSEKDILGFALEGIEPREGLRFGRQVEEARTLEAQVMDWADDIAYAVHDAEDFFRAGMIPLHAIGANGRESREFIEYAFQKILDRLPPQYDVDAVLDLLSGSDERIDDGIDVFGLMPEKPYDGSLAMRADLHVLASTLIRAATANLKVDDNGILLPREDIFVVIEILKKLTEYYVIDRPALGSAQMGQRQLLIELVARLHSWARSNIQEILRDEDGGLNAAGQSDRLTQHRRARLTLPPRLNDYYAIALDTTPSDDEGLTFADLVLRSVIDYVSSLTDDQAVAMHARICKGDVKSMLEPWLFL